MAENTLRATEFLISDTTEMNAVNAGGHGRGLVPRNLMAHPIGKYGRGTKFDMPLIPREEWVERCKEMAANKSRLSDIRRSSGPDGKHIPSLDQNGQGYCWNHSATMCNMLLRAVANLPYVKLSAYMVGCLIKNYRDEGGWGAQALDFIAEKGQPTVQFWPEGGMDKKYDTPAMWENAALHKITEGWVDLAAAQYDRNLTEDQAMTSLFCRTPLIGDFNWWGHSVCLMDPVLVSELKTARPQDLDLNNPNDLAVLMAAFGKRGLNSWTDSYGDLGEFTLTGTKAILNGGAAPRLTMASAI